MLIIESLLCSTFSNKLDKFILFSFGIEDHCKILLFTLPSKRGVRKERLKWIVQNKTFIEKLPLLAKSTVV